MRFAKDSSSHHQRSSLVLWFRVFVAGLLLLSLWLVLQGYRTTHLESQSLLSEHIILSSTRTSQLQFTLPSLSELANTRIDHEAERKVCAAKSFVYIDDVIAVKHMDSTSVSRIPKIIHQTSRSRCLTQMFAKISAPWRSLRGYGYYLHDDDAMMRLLTSQSEEFPLLHDLVQAGCLPHGTLKADIWRYLVLWNFGGIYADIDTQPTSLFNTTNPILKPTDDAWFVVEQFHILSQYVMAVSPRHPLMYYAIHHATNKILQQMDTGRINAALVTGPHALHRAFQERPHPRFKSFK